MPHRTVVPESASVDPSDAALHESWLLGLMGNPALPTSVLRRLLTVDRTPGNVCHWLQQRVLPPGATAAIVADGDVRHRRAVLENPNADSAALVPLAYDPDPGVRRIYVAIAPDFRRDIPPAALQALADDEVVAVRACTAGYPDLPLPIRARLAQDPEPKVRAAALRTDWELLPTEVRTAALTDPAPEVRQAVEQTTWIDPPLPRTVGQYLQDTEKRRHLAAGAAPISRELALLLVTDEDVSVRHALAGNPHTPTDVALRLAEDVDNGVRLTLSQREDLTEEQRAAIAYVVPNKHTWPPKWIEERGHEPEVARRAAASGHVLLRRSIAMAGQLPPDVVARLAADEDFFVKLTLCEYCPDAPHDLVIEMYAYWHGLRWSLLMRHPNFAGPGLARFADDPNPRLRHAALHDPDGGPDLLLKLADDPYVGRWAVSDPRLPNDELARRLHDRRYASAAARNPALPVETMHHLLDLAAGPAAAPGNVCPVDDGA